jgi:hypothetical protein
MSLPSAVQAQVDDANRLQAAMLAPEEPVVAQDPPVEQETQAQHVQDAIPEETWEHKYRSEIGRFKAETDRAREAAQAAWQQVEHLRQEIEQVKQAKTSEPEPPPVPGVTEQDIETFGSDLVQFTERATRKAVADAQKVWDAKSQALLKVIDELRGQVGNVESQTARTAEQAFYDRLAQEVPDWQTTNNDPAFHAWLQEENELSGVPRQQFLNHAHSTLDIGRVVRFFNTFKNTSQTPVATPVRPSAQSDLQRQVSPPKTRTGSVTAPSNEGKRIWTEKDIGKFYEAKARGQLDAQEAARMEADLNQAVAEGRVR